MIFNKNSKTLKAFSRVVSLILIPAFLCSGISFATPQEKVPDLIAREVVTNPNNVIIPREYGLVKSKYSADSGKLVIHIQDAHCNYEAQSNIVKILESLVKNYSLKFVAVEGADGVIDTSWFKAFPDEAVRKEVADYFMKKGEITGPEFLSITTDYPVKLFGAETRSYYLQNLNAFTSSYPLKAETEKYFNTIKAALNKLKGFIYSDELKSLDAKDAEYEAKKLQFNEYVRFLQAEAEKNKINLREYENLFKLINVLIYEKKIDFSVTDKERTDLIDEVTKKLTKEGIAQLVTQSISFKMGKISSADYYNYLKSLATANGMDLAKDYPNLYNYIIYNSVYSKIENEKLFQDITAVEAAIKEKLFKNDDQRTLEKLSRHIDTLIGLVNIKLLNSDFDYYKNHKEEFAAEVFADFIQKKSAQYGLAVTIEPPTDTIRNSISKLEDFYAIAIKRDKALVDNTLGEMKREDRRIAVLVTGGFHSEGIAKLLEKEGISYMVVCPSITKDVPTPYIQVLTNQRTSFEDIVMGAAEPAQQGMLAPASIAWAVGLNEKEVRKVYQETNPAKVPQEASLEGTLEGRVLRVKNWWIVYHLTVWMDRAFRYVNGNLHRIGQQEDVMKEAYAMALDYRLSNLVKDGVLTQGRADEVKERITGSKAFNEEFHQAFVLAQSRSQREEVVAQAEVEKAPDTSAREKTVGATLTDDRIDEAIRGSKTITVFDDGDVPADVRQQFPGYAVIADIVVRRIQALGDDVFANILSSPHVNAAPGSKLAEVFTKENLLKMLRKGSGLKIKLVEPAQDVVGITAPGIVMTKTGSNFGHYSTKNNTLYVPAVLMELLTENLSIPVSGSEELIAAEISHELAEYMVLKLAFPDKVVLEEVKDTEVKAHFIAQLLEIALAGSSPTNTTTIMGPRSALDDLLDDMTTDYFRHVTELEKGPIQPDALKKRAAETTVLIERGKDAYAKIMGNDKRDEGYNLSLTRLLSMSGIDVIISDNIIKDTEKEAVAKLIAFGKGSVFRFWGELTDAQKRELIDQIMTLNIEQAQQYYKDYIVDSKEGAKVKATQENLATPRTDDLTQGDSPENQQALQAGEQAFKNGEVAVLELAGGSGSRLKYFDPKIMYHASQVMGMSLARLRAQKIKALSQEYGKPVPWIIMTSDVTDKKTRAYFEKRIVGGKYFGEVPVGWVRFVRQRSMPRMTNNGEFILGATRDECDSDNDARERARCHIAVGGFGHGDARDFVLNDPNTQEWLQGFKVKYVMMVNVDNAFLAGARSIGHHILSGKELRPGTEHISKLVVLKTKPEEPIGMTVLIDGKDGIIEYNQVPADKPYLPYVYVSGNDKFILYKDDQGAVSMLSLDEFAAVYGRESEAKKLVATKDGVANWLKDHCPTVDQLPDDVRFHFLGREYTRQTLSEAVLWLRLGNINTIIWSLSSFTDKSHPLHILPVVVAKNKAIDGFHPESGAYNAKEKSTLLVNAFEVMAFHGFLVDPVKGTHIITDRAGAGREGGFAPIKEKKGTDTPERAKELLSEYDCSLLTELLSWDIARDERTGRFVAVVEMTPRFGFLDGRYLRSKLGENSHLGNGARLHLSGPHTTIGSNLKVADNAEFILRVNDEDAPLAFAKVGNNVDVRAKAAFTIYGNGKLIIDDDVVFEDSAEIVVNDGEVVRVVKTLTKAERQAKTQVYASVLYETRTKAGIPGTDKDDWFQAETKVNKEFPINGVFKARIPSGEALARVFELGNNQGMQFFDDGSLVDLNLWEQTAPDAMRLKNDASVTALKLYGVWLRAGTAGNTGVGAIRTGGGELAAAEHGTRGATIDMIRDEASFNGTAASLIGAGSAYALVRTKAAKPGDIEIELGAPDMRQLDNTQATNLSRLMSAIQDKGVSFIVVKGLKDELKARGVATDVIFHPGIARRAIYIDESDLTYLLSLENGAELISEAIAHEKAHIDNPKLSEAEVEKLAPTTNVRRALEAKGLSFASTAGINTIDTRVQHELDPYDVLKVIIARMNNGKEPTYAEVIAYKNAVKKNIEKETGKPVNEMAGIGVKVPDPEKVSVMRIGTFLNVYRGDPLWVVAYDRDTAGHRLAVVNMRTKQILTTDIYAESWVVTDDILNTAAEEDVNTYVLSPNAVVNGRTASLRNTIDTRYGDPSDATLRAVLEKMEKSTLTDKAVQEYKTELKKNLSTVLRRTIEPLAGGIFIGAYPLWVVQYGTDKEGLAELAVINLKTKQILAVRLKAEDWMVNDNVLYTNSEDNGQDSYQLKADEVVDISRARSLTKARPAGAIRVTGTELTPYEHGTRSATAADIRNERTVNGVIAALIEEGKAFALVQNYITIRPGDIDILQKRPEDLNDIQAANLNSIMHDMQDIEMNFVLITGLRAELAARGVAPDLVLHPGIERRSVYLDEQDFLYLLSLSNGAKLLSEAIRHEIAHINNPDIAEVDIENMAPTYNIRLALTLKPVSAERSAVKVENRRYREGNVYDYVDSEQARVYGMYERPLPKFAKFGTSGVRWLVKGALQVLAARYPRLFEYITSCGYTQEDFSLPNVGIIAKAIALYNLRKAQGFYRPVAGTTAEFAKKLNDKGILITYDNRPGNLAYARMIARILAAYGIKVTMAQTEGQFAPASIPVTSLLVQREGYAAAITLTASHNGDMWNGIKFETEDGAPASPIATNAIGSILNEELSLAEPNYDIAKEGVDALIKKGAITTVDAVGYYVKAVLGYLGKERVDRIRAAIKDGKVALKYSAFFGSSGVAMKRLFQELGLPMDELIETQKPNENTFVESYEPTLEKLLDLESMVSVAGQVAGQVGQPTVVLGAASDNDADRFQVCEYNPKTGQVEEFKPDRLTAILGHYLAKSRNLEGKVTVPGKPEPQPRSWGRSFVSSTYQDYVAKLFGHTTTEEATGFKFSPSTLNKGGIIYSEESYGLSFNGWTLDKDGILPALLSLELVANTGKSLSEYNATIKEELKAAGLRSDFFFARDDLKLNDTLQKKAIERFTKFFDGIVVGQTEFAGKKIVKKYDPKTVEGGMKFVLEDDSWVALRSSGTEPVIRLYREARSEKESQELRKELFKLTGLDEKPSSSDMSKEKVKTPKKADIQAASVAEALKRSLQGKISDDIYKKYISNDLEALYFTLNGIGVDEQRKNKPVILVYDTGIEPNVDTSHVARAGEVAINKYLNGMVVEVRGTGKALLEAVRVQAAKIGPNYSVVTIAGNTTLDEINKEIAREGKPGANINDDLGTVINVQNPDNKYIPIIGLYDVALRIAYDLDKDAIVERLNRLALNPNGTPFTKDDLSKGVIRILPRIAPANMTEAVEAYKAAQQALQSL